MMITPSTQRRRYMVNPRSSYSCQFVPTPCPPRTDGPSPPWWTGTAQSQIYLADWHTPVMDGCCRWCIAALGSISSRLSSMSRWRRRPRGRGRWTSPCSRHTPRPRSLPRCRRWFWCGCWLWYWYVVLWRPLWNHGLQWGKYNVMWLLSIITNCEMLYISVRRLS